jgi:hypothetical protein
MSACRSGETYAAGHCAFSPSFNGKRTIACPGLSAQPHERGYLAA